MRPEGTVYLNRNRNQEKSEEHCAQGLRFFLIALYSVELYFLSQREIVLKSCVKSVCVFAF